MGKIARLKRRPSSRPFLILIPDCQYLEENGISLTETGRKLANRFWPGPLTLILPISPGSPLSFLAHQGGLAVRISSHPFARALFRHRRFPLISTSANRSGAPEDHARDPGWIMETFADTISYFITEGTLAPSPPSTLLDLRVSPPRLIREGALPFIEIAPFF
jgi:L-threonylcarbamoyladenylate synthase